MQREISEIAEGGRPVIDVLMQGRSSVDLTFLGLTELPRLGEEHHATGFAMNPGAGFIIVAALARLGLRTAFATDIGNDFFSRYILDQLRLYGVDETFFRFHERDLGEVSVGLSFPHERSFVTWDAGREWHGQGVLPEDLLAHRARLLFTHQPFSPATFAEARRQGIPICIDTFWDTRYLASAAVQTAITQATAFLPNRLEALAITGAADPETALQTLARRVPMVAIKMGTQGVIGSYRGRRYHVPALPVTAIDTTGAGDNFNAGFMYGMLHDLPFEECLRCGVVAGSLSTTCPGGVQGSPTEAELLEGLRGLPAR